jgi:hypothetical protein
MNEDDALAALTWLMWPSICSVVDTNRQLRKRIRESTSSKPEKPASLKRTPPEFFKGSGLKPISLAEAERLGTHTGGVLHISPQPRPGSKKLPKG